MELNLESAEKWAEQSNSKKQGKEPAWSWDCGFKLDFDGELLSVESRFYPPHKNTGDFWEGMLHVKFLETVILEKEFRANSLDQLKEFVEEFTQNYIESIKARLL